MAEHDHDELQRLVDLASLLPPDQREALLDRECGDDADLKRRVLELLAAERVAREHEPGAATADVPAAGATIGAAYRLLKHIGEGGFGSVWMAEQREPVKRNVALKVIKLGMDTRQVIARFEAERQALAMMDHPNIAKVLDAGSTDTGRPYFVMEYIKGVPILARPFSTRTRRGSSTATSSRATCS
jgi:non-specific serine/threonine protein kinase/serine/threonine-protein kinase